MLDNIEKNTKNSILLLDREEVNKKQNRNDFIFTFVIGILAVFLVFVSSCWLSLRTIQQTSMTYTLSNGDIVFSDNFAKPERFDIVIFSHGDKDLIKRLIAFEGDTVYNDVDGNLYLIKSGETEPKKLDESYLRDGYKTWDEENKREGGNGLFRVTVPSGCFFALGDNRRWSSDCRDFIRNQADMANNGCIKNSCIQGVVPEWSIKIKGFTTKLFSLFRKK